MTEKIVYRNSAQLMEAFNKLEKEYYDKNLLFQANTQQIGVMQTKLSMNKEILDQLLANYTLLAQRLIQRNDRYLSLMNAYPDAANSLGMVKINAKELERQVNAKKQVIESFVTPQSVHETLDLFKKAKQAYEA